MTTPDNPQNQVPDETPQTFAEEAPGSGVPALAFDDRAKKSWFSRLPIISHLRQSVGLQRGLLITGLVLCGIVLICAIFAPLIAPYGFNQLGTSEGFSFTDGTVFTIWISDDENKIPLYLESPVRIGSINAYLSGYKGLKYPLKSRIK